MGDFKKGDKVLYITPTPAAPAEVAQLQETVGAEGSVKVISRSQIGADKLEEPASAYDVVISVGASAASHQTDFLFELARVLKPSGNLILREPLILGNKEGIVTSLRTEKEVESALLISGFTSTTAKNTQTSSSTASFPALNGSADVQTEVSTFEIRAVKPDWEVGASAALSLPKTKVSAAPVWSLSADDTLDDDIPVIKPAAAGSTWKLDADDGDLIEDEALLEKEDLAKPEKVFDCGTSDSGKRKACKNCSCGLAEELATEAGKEIKKKTPEQASACGNCYLGDAFRCASCPYAGLPAFKPGEKISLANMD